MMKKYRIGIDIGGSHVGVGLVKDKNIIDILGKNFSKEDFANIEENIITTIVNFIDNILTNNNLVLGNIEVIGIASPGTISNGVIVKAGNLKLSNFDILSELKKYYNIPIIVRNDGKCAALAEKTYGAMKDYSDCVFINIGTGIGGAVFLNGKLLEPKKYPGFEFGHMIVKKDGTKCTCGKNGCFETYSSIKALKINISKKLNITNEISGKELKEKILETNLDEIREIVDEYTDYLKIGIGNIIDIFEPEVICFGGSFSYYRDSLIWQETERKLNDGNVSFNNNLPKFVFAEFENNAGIIGAVIE